MHRVVPFGSALARIPAPSFFVVSALFHYLGPSFAVLLFSQVSVLGVAFLRIWSAAVAFGVWRRPWRTVLRSELSPAVWGFALVLTLMNSVFYLAIARLPLSTVGAIEFLGTVLLAASGLRTMRNFGALALTAVGVATITQIRLSSDPLGFIFAFMNCVLFMAYVVLGHRLAQSGTGIDQLAIAMLLAAIFVTPIGLRGATPAFSKPELLLAGAGVGICSSVIPYVTDQLAMARLPRATFALMLSLLPIFATIIGAIVLRQMPSELDILGIALVSSGVALHRQDKL
jgi:inner membrane transporter RhtA